MQHIFSNLKNHPLLFMIEYVKLNNYISLCDDFLCRDDKIKKLYYTLKINFLHKINQGPAAIPAISKRKYSP